MFDKFAPGVRVVHICRRGSRNHGTIVALKKVHRSINFLRSKDYIFLDVIYDDGSRAEDEAAEFWLESEYDPLIPF